MDTGEWDLLKNKQTFVFQTDGRCKFTEFSFDGYAKNPPDLTQQPVTLPSATITYDYDGRPISPYTFRYKTDDSTVDGNGSGIVKN